MIARRRISNILVSFLGLLIVCSSIAQTADTEDETKTGQQSTNTEQPNESVPAEPEQKRPAEPKATPSQPQSSRKSFRPSEEISEDRPVPFPVDI